MMKKSQILSAIALAFALGVIAPVAGASAFSIQTYKADGSIKEHGKASCLEARTAVEAVKADGEYSKLLAFYDVAVANDENTVRNMADARDVKVININTSMAADIVTKIKGVFDNLPSQVISLSTKARTVFNAPTATNVEAELIDEILAAVKGVNGYNEFKAIKDAVEANNGVGDAAALTAALNAYNVKYTPDFTNTDGREMMAAVKNGTTGVAHYDNNVTFYNNVITYVERGEAIMKAYEAGLKALEDAYKALLGNGQILAAGETAYKNTVTDANWVDLAAFAQIVLWAPAGVPADPMDINGANIANANLWDAVTTEIKDVTCTTQSRDQGAIYKNQLSPLAAAYEAAVNPKYTDKSVDEVAQILVGFHAATDVVVPDGPEDKPTVSAPDTGALTAADNSASATISIVAGLATALAALGAGVVAFRSARRSK